VERAGEKGRGGEGKRMEAREGTEREGKR